MCCYLTFVEKTHFQPFWDKIWTYVLSRRIQPYLPPSLKLFSGLELKGTAGCILAVQRPAKKNSKVSIAQASLWNDSTKAIQCSYIIRIVLFYPPLGRRGFKFENWWRKPNLLEMCSKIKANLFYSNEIKMYRQIQKSTKGKWAL